MYHWRIYWDYLHGFCFSIIFIRIISISVSFEQGKLIANWFFTTKQAILSFFKFLYYFTYIFFWLWVWAPKPVYQYQKPPGYGTATLLNSLFFSEYISSKWTVGVEKIHSIRRWCMGRKNQMWFVHLLLWIFSTIFNFSNTLSVYFNYDYHIAIFYLF